MYLYFTFFQFYHENGFPKTYLHTFIDKPLNEDVFRNHHTNSCCAVASFMCLSQCCHRYDNTTSPITYRYSLDGEERSPSAYLLQRSWKSHGTF